MLRNSTVVSLGLTVVLAGCLQGTETVPLGHGLFDSGSQNEGGTQLGTSGQNRGEVGGGKPVGAGGSMETGGVREAAGGGGSAGTTAAGTGPGGGDSGSNLPVCSELPEPPRNIGCVRPKGGWPVQSNTDVAERKARFDGTITAIGAASSGGCLANDTGYAGIDDPSRTVALTVAETTDAGTQEWSIEYEVPSSTVTWAVGQPISVDYSLQMGRFRPDVSLLVIGSARGIELEISAAGDALQLQSSNIEFRRGSPVCHQEHECGPWEGYQLEARDSAAGDAWVSIPYGGSVVLGEYRVASGQLARNLPQTPNRCADWYIAAAHAAVTRAQ